MYETVNAERIHISFFGRRNVGKSSLVNAVTGQELCIVSNVKGTTTDPVSKAMELLPMGAVVITDTPGIDDDGVVGKMRIEKAMRVLDRTNIAVLVVSSEEKLGDVENMLIDMFNERSIPYIVVLNKCDLTMPINLKENEIAVSSIENTNIFELKEKIAKIQINKGDERKLISDKLSKSDIVVLVTPIDSSAPKGRMILPQVQTIRDILDKNAVCIVTQTEQLELTLNSLKSQPRLVITDSQAFMKVKDIVPSSIMLTSFSILFAHYKGVLEHEIQSVLSIDNLKNGDTVLIAEGCTHHRQCEDIGTVKLPSLLKKHTGKDLLFEFTSGTEFPKDLRKYSLIIHCGGCMLNNREMQNRQERAKKEGIPFTNYGITISYLNGILKRSLEVFPEM